MLSNTTTVKKILAPCATKITNLVKYIKPNVHTYRSLLRDEMCSMLVVPVGLKQGELGVPVRHLSIQQ
jgi:hypothetical protein